MVSKATAFFRLLFWELFWEQEEEEEAGSSR